MASNILLIEDDDLVRESVTDLLMISGYDVDSANNGEEGLQKILAIKPALVICDVMMPVMDGFELLKRVKEQGLLGQMYFMFLTAKTREGDMETGRKLGAHDYMIKPFRNSDLLAKVQEIVGF